MLWLAAMLVALPQRFVSDTPLQPFTTTSPSGEWSLRVDPSSRIGAGKSTIAISRHGVVKWTGEKPFTFQEAVVDDQGVSAGYGYTHGPESDEGSFVVALLDAGGESLFVENTPREPTRQMHGSPDPQAQGIVLHPERKLAIVCIADPDSESRSEAWRVYSMSPAKALEVVHPARELEGDEEVFYSCAIAPVRGTPLTLAHWFTWPPEFGRGYQAGSTFALYDESWKLVWSLPLPGDLTLADQRAEDQLCDAMRQGRGVLSTKTERRFEVRHVAKGERVTFEVSRDAAAAKGWSVREVARLPFEESKESAGPPPIATVELPRAGSTKLAAGAGQASGPVRKIQAFALGEQGRVTIVRDEGEGAFVLVTLAPGGSVERQVAVSPFAAGSVLRPAWIAAPNGDWLVTCSDFGDNAVTRIWRIAGATGVPRELPALEGVTLDGIDSAADGGFAALVRRSMTYTSSESVLRCASDGSVQWSLGGDGGHESESAMFSPEDVALAADGSAFVLDNIRHLVQRFDARGQFVDALELEQSWQADFMYPTEVLPRPDGTLWVFDFHDKVWHHLARDGKELGRFSPHRANGDTDVGDPSHVVCDDQGRLWGCDDYQVFTFDEQGLAETRFGAAPDPKRLGEPGQVFLDGGGRFAIEDEATHSAHVFAADGRRLFVCTPEPKDIEEDDDVQDVCSSPDGTVYVQFNSYADEYLAFGPDGSRKGPAQLGGQRVAFDRKSGARWALSSQKFESTRLCKFDAGGKLVFETDRRPDGSFFEGAYAVAVGPDGGAVVLQGDTGMMARGPSALCWYGPQGEPLEQRALGDTNQRWASHLQAGRRWVVMSGFDDEAVLVSRPEGACFRFKPTEGEDKGLWGFGLSPDESELWALESATQTMHRFTLPK